MEESTEKSPIDIIIDLILIGFKNIGIPPDNFTWKVKIWLCFLFAANVAWFLLCGVHFKTQTTLEGMSDDILNLGIMTQPIAGVLTIYIYRHVLVQTLHIMKSSFWFHNIPSQLLPSHLLYYRILHYIRSTYLVICSVTLSIWFLEPLVHSTGKFPMDLTFPGKNFIKERPWYQITYAMQMVSVCFATLLVMLLDIIYLTGMGLVMMQIDLVKHKLREINDGKNEEEVNIKVNTCIKHHTVLLKTLQGLEEVCSFLMLDKLLCCIICLCVTTYLFTEELSFNLKFIFTLASSGCQPFLYCFFGDFVTSACESIGQEAYEVNWQNHGYKSLTSSLRMMIHRSQQPVLMTAGGMIVFSLTTYVSYMKLMFSFYLLLKHDK